MALHEVVGFRGVTTPEQHQRLTDANYAGLYATSGEEAVRRKKQMAFSGKAEDFMGPDELAANIFQRSQIRQAVERENLQKKPVKPLYLEAMRMQGFASA